MVDGDHGDLRHDPTSQAIAAIRDRSVLAQLLSPLDPGEADAVADRLIARYGSLPATLDGCRLLRQGDQHTNFLCTVYDALHLCVTSRIKAGPVLSTSSATVEYLMLTMAHRLEEHVRILFLDAQNCLIADEITATGTVDKTHLSMRDIFRQAFDLGAAGMILAHNHPGGGLEPSEEDVMATRDLAAAGRLLDVPVLDHLILGSTGCVSLRSRGLM